MKRLLITCIALVFILSGCYISEPIETEKAQKFYEEIQQEFEFVKSIRMYKKSPSDTLVIRYVCEDTRKEDIARCFETTRRWLIEEGNLEAMQENSEELIENLDIGFDLPTRKQYYKASYDTLSAQGDGFNKWYHEVVEKEEK